MSFNSTPPLAPSHIPSLPFPFLAIHCRSSRRRWCRAQSQSSKFGLVSGLASGNIFVFLDRLIYLVMYWYYEFQLGRLLLRTRIQDYERDIEALIVICSGRLLARNAFFSRKNLPSFPFPPNQALMLSRTKRSVCRGLAPSFRRGHLEPEGAAAASWFSARKHPASSPSPGGVRMNIHVCVRLSGRKRYRKRRSRSVVILK